MELKQTKVQKFKDQIYKERAEFTNNFRSITKEERHTEKDT